MACWRPVLCLPAGRFSPLRTFQGRWRVQPQPPERCAQAHSDTSQAAGSSNACCELTLQQVSENGRCCWVQLYLRGATDEHAFLCPHAKKSLVARCPRQELQPAVWLPPPLGGLLRQLACSQLRGVFQDLQSEAAKINAGRPSLWEAQPP